MSSLGEIHSVSPFIVGGKNSTRDIAVRSGGCAGAGEREDARGTPPFRSLDTNNSAPHAHRHKRRSLAVPLSFFTQRPVSGPDRAALPAALPDALHIPPPQAPFQPVKGPLCSLTWTLLFRSSRLQVSILSFLGLCVKSAPFFLKNLVCQPEVDRIPASFSCQGSHPLLS